MEKVSQKPVKAYIHHVDNAIVSLELAKEELYSDLKTEIEGRNTGEMRLKLDLIDDLTEVQEKLEEWQ